MRYTPFIILFFFVLFPHIFENPIWVSVSASLIAIHAYFALTGRIKLLGPKVCGLLSFFAVGAVLFKFRTLLGPEPGTAALIILSALKLEELRSERDGIIFLLLLSLLSMTYLLFDQSILSTLYMLTTAVAVYIGLMALNTPREHFVGIMKSTPRLVGKDLLISLPLFIVLFAFFPRFSTPWASLMGDGRTPTGFSDELQPGQMAELAKSRELAFVAIFAGNKIPPPSRIYWRGITLTETDGWAWSKPKNLITAKTEKLTADEIEAPVAYKVQLQPRFEKTIFSLEQSENINWTETTMYNPVFKRIDGSFASRYPVVTVLQYESLASVINRHEESLLPEDRQRLLTVGTISPELQELANKISHNRAPPQKIALNLMQYLATEGFVYSLSTPEMKSVDDFLFSKKIGFCEHFASAFAVTLRVAGVPTRVISGFQGGEINPYSRYLLVRDQHAHSWVEYHDGTHWVRVDPTNAVSPLRINFGSLSEALPLEVGYSKSTLGLAILQMQMMYGALEQSYTSFLLNYNYDLQSSLLNFNMSARAKRWLLFGLAIVIGSILFLFMRRFMRTTLKQDPVLLFLAKIRGKLQLKGLAFLPKDPPHTVFSKASQKWPHLSHDLNELSEMYSTIRYKSDFEFQDKSRKKKWLKKMQSTWRNIESQF